MNSNNCITSVLAIVKIFLNFSNVGKIRINPVPDPNTYTLGQRVSVATNLDTAFDLNGFEWWWSLV